MRESIVTEVRPESRVVKITFTEEW
jgi:hypothetical protein